MQLKWRLSHIRGYIELGMVAEAAAELQQIPASSAGEDEVLAVQLEFLQEVREWPHAVKVATELVHRHPEEAGWWIALAYATRRAESIHAAEAILLEAEKRHAADATIQFNLGCYAAQTGQLLAARARVQRAVELDPHFAEAAKTDPDLAPLRQTEFA